MAAAYISGALLRARAVISAITPSPHAHHAAATASRRTASRAAAIARL